MSCSNIYYIEFVQIHGEGEKKIAHVIAFLRMHFESGENILKFLKSKCKVKEGDKKIHDRT